MPQAPCRLAIEVATEPGARGIRPHTRACALSIERRAPGGRCASRRQNPESGSRNPWFPMQRQVRRFKNSVRRIGSIFLTAQKILIGSIR
jgi:hypothetical protein